jgi:hypothetical protein
MSGVQSSSLSITISIANKMLTKAIGNCKDHCSFGLYPQKLENLNNKKRKPLAKGGFLG